MGPPFSHHQHQENSVRSLGSHQGWKLIEIVESQQTVSSPHNNHSDCVAEGITEQAIDAGPPVVEDVLREFPGEIVGQETADKGNPQEHKAEEMPHDIEGFVFLAEAKAEVPLRKHQKKKVLKVPVENKRNQVHRKAEGPQKDGDPEVEEQPEAEPEDDISDENQEEVEGEEIPAGRQEGLPFPL